MLKAADRSNQGSALRVKQSLAKLERSASAGAPLVARLLQRKCACGSHAAGGQCEACSNESAELRRKGAYQGAFSEAVPVACRLRRRANKTDTGQAEAPSIVHDVLRSSGRPLDPQTRAFFEPRFGHEFSRVRVHADARAAASARAVNALAYTIGDHVAFGHGQYAPDTPEGRRLLAHELTHVVQQRGVEPPNQSSPIVVGRVSSPHEHAAAANAEGQNLRAVPGSIDRPLLQRQPAQQSLRDQICYRPGMVPSNRQASDCDAREPENCATYEQWLNTFRRLRTFTARDTAPGGTAETGFTALGQRATRPVDNPNAPTEERPPPEVNEQVSDRFIDHPTDQWVTTCLPDNLRETAYRLPSDCADIAVILRHVWLSGHHRTETYGTWTVGDAAGRARRQEVGRIIGEVYTGNVKAMVNPYSDASGHPLQTFAALSNLLHPGDVLVWEHHSGGLGTRRTGGHTQTVVSIVRADDGTVTRINVLQGNQPIFSPQAQEIRANIGAGAPSEQTLRDAPGRRIETDHLSEDSLRDLEQPVAQGRAATRPPEQRWTWSDGNTTLVAAGPPAAAPRPSARRVGGQTIRRISDWFAQLASAARSRLQAIFEAALLELRAMIEGGQTGLNTDAATLGRTAGERLWSLARGQSQTPTGDLAEETHFMPLRQIRATIQAIGDPTGQGGTVSSATPSAPTVRTIFNSVDENFNLAARGATTISFGRRVPTGTRVVKVLVTGFDPFVSGTGPVPAGTVNPSGEAALALDNTTLNVGQKRAAVEGVVLPVSFAEFRTGLVENIVRPLVQSRGVDAVLTVSLDASIAPADPVRIERYVVGVHQEGGAIGAIPAASSAGLGPALIEVPSPVEKIAQETARPATRQAPAIPQPTIGTDVTFQFASVAAANSALTALGQKTSSESQVTISDVTALKQIISTMQRDVTGTDISFEAGGNKFRASVLSGPGGNFLSNEVSFRVLRLLGEQNRLDLPSFHVHVQRALQSGGTIPQAPGAARRQAVSEARGVRDRLVETLKRMISAVVRRIAP
jgi:hypothetical protein